MVMKDAQRRGLIAVNVAADSKIGTAKRHKPKIKAGTDFPHAERSQGAARRRGPEG